MRAMLRGSVSSMFRLVLYHLVTGRTAESWVDWLLNPQQYTHFSKSTRCTNLFPMFARISNVQGLQMGICHNQIEMFITKPFISPQSSCHLGLLSLETSSTLRSLALLRLSFPFPIFPRPFQYSQYGH